MVGVDDAARCRTAILDRHVESVHDQVRILDTVDGPANDASRVRVEHATAVDLSLSRGVFRYVRAPQLVGPVAMEPAVHEIVGRHDATQSFDPGGTGKAVNAGVMHEHRHESLADEDAQTLREFGVHASLAVGAAALQVHFSNETRKPFTTHLGGRERPLTVAVVTRTRDSQRATTNLDGEPGVDENVDHRVNPFG